MSSSDRSDDVYHDVGSKPPSPGAASSTSTRDGESTPTQSKPGLGMQASAHEEGDTSTSIPQPPDRTSKGPPRQDSITNILDDHAFYTVEGRGRIRSSFSFGGQKSEQSVRQQSIVALPEQPLPGPSPRSSVPSPAAEPSSSDSETRHSVPSSSSWTYSLVWLHQTILDLSNTVYPLRARRAWEWCDFDSTPVQVRQTCQNILTKQWTRKLVPLQFASPAVTASKELAEIINKVSDFNARPLEVFEFAAGSGGPTPVFEQQINEDRLKKGLSPLEFRISDLYPNPAAWKDHTAKSEHLTVVEEPVDATKPPAFARR